MADLSSVDWVALGKGVGAFLGVALAAGTATWGAGRRVWKKGLADLLRPVVTAELRKAGRVLAEDLRRPVAELRTDHEELAKEVNELGERVARVEGAVSTLAGQGRGSSQIS